jgi:hypothetical protein
MRRHSWLLALAVLVAAGASAQTTPATYQVTVNYTAPTQYIDGTPIPAGTVITYNVYAGTAGPASETLAQTNVRFSSALLSGYTAGQTVYIEVTALVNGVESPRSAEVSVAVKAPVKQSASPSGVTASQVPSS